MRCRNVGSLTVIYQEQEEKMMSFDIQSDSLLTIDDICAKLSISRSTFDRLRAPKVRSIGAMVHRSTGAMQVAMRSASHGGNSDFDSAPQFPEPTCTIGRSPRWSAKVINAWIESASTSR